MYLRAISSIQSFAVPAAVIGGGFLALESHLIGPSIWLHEVGGHHYLGWRLSHSGHVSYDYEVKAWRKLDQLQDQQGIVARIRNFVSLHFEIFSDVIQMKEIGSCRSYGGTPNCFGRVLGGTGRLAWFSLAGSLPALLLSASLGITARKFSFNSPVLKQGIIGFALAHHAFSAYYLMTALVCLPLECGLDSHDFVVFSRALGAERPVPSYLVALAVSVVYSASIPTLFIFV